MAGVARCLLDRNGVTLDNIAWISPALGHRRRAGHRRPRARRGAGPDPLQLRDDRKRAFRLHPGRDQSIRFNTSTIKPGELILSAAVGTGWYAAAALYSVGAP